MRKKRLPILIVMGVLVITSLYLLMNRDQPPNTVLIPNEELDPTKITVITHTPDEDFDPLKITVLTHSPNDDLGPVWSPDGAYIAFVGHHEGNPEVYMLDMASGELANISNSPSADYNPSWSPDGQYLAFWRRDAYESIHVVVRDLTAGTEIESPNNKSPYEPLSWSPDSQRLFFTGYSDEMQCISVYEVHSAAYQNLACRDTPYSTSMSPDASWMLIVGDDMEAELVDLESGQSRTLNEVGHNEAVWAPDSRAFAYRNEDRATICIYHVSVNRSKCLILPKTDRDPIIIGWSPTGQLAWAEEGSPTTFYVMEPHATTFREVATMDELPLAWAWSPQGQFIGFKSIYGIYALDTETGTLDYPVRRLDDIEDLQWSSDGQYMSSSLSKEEVGVVHLLTGEILFIDGFISWQPISWAPDGTRFVGVCGEYGVTNLCLVELP